MKQSLRPERLAKEISLIVVKRELERDDNKGSYCLKKDIIDY